jgi:hypothetical protein
LPDNFFPSLRFHYGTGGKKNMPSRLFARIVTGLFILLLCGVLCGPAFAIEPNIHAVPAEVKHIHQLMQKLGAGQGALVAVRLKDKSAVAGYVREAGPDSMVIVDTKTGEATQVSYYDVDRMQGYNLETKTEVHQNTGIRSKVVKFATWGMPGHQIPENGFAHSTALIVGVIIGIILAIVLAKVF